MELEGGGNGEVRREDEVAEGEYSRANGHRPVRFAGLASPVGVQGGRCHKELEAQLPVHPR
eukprot:5011-Eustigmatos_ZCMA.PRE.1